LALAIIVAATGAFFALTKNQTGKNEPNEPVESTPSFKIGVINTQKAIESHPDYPAGISLQKEEAALWESFEKTRENLITKAREEALSARERFLTALSEEFNVKMKVKQDELEKKVLEKSRLLGEPLNQEMEAYARQLEVEYQEQMVDLRLKLNVFQMEDDQTKKNNCQNGRAEKRRSR